MKKLFVIACLLPASYLFAGDSVSVNEMKIELMQKQVDAQQQQLEEKKNEIEILMQHHEDAMERQLVIYTGIFLGVLAIASWLLNWLGKKEVRNLAKEIANKQIQDELKTRLSKEALDAKFTEVGKPLIDEMILNAKKTIDTYLEEVRTKKETISHELDEFLKDLDPTKKLTQQQKEQVDDAKQKSIEEIKAGSSTQSVISFLYTKALKAYDIKDWNTAISYFNDVIELDDKNENTLIRRGYAYDMLKQFDKAKKDYEKTIELNNNNEIAHYNLAIILTNELKDYKGAKQHYEKALEINPNSAEANYSLGLVLMNYFKDYENAKLHYEKAIQLNPNYANAHYFFAVLLQNDHFKKYEESKQHYEKVIELEPNAADAHISLAYLLKNHFNNASKAKELYLKATELDPSQKTPERNKDFGVE